MPLRDTVKATVHDELAGIAALGRQAAASKAYLYPLNGIAYFLAHRPLWQPLTSRLVPLICLSTGVISVMFLLTYVPQSLFLTFLNGPIAWVSTVALVLSESAAIITAVSRTFLIDEALLDIFDAVMLQEGLTELVKHGREVNDMSGSGVIARMGKTLKMPFERLTLRSLISHLVWFPVNFIPVVGTVVFIFVQGRNLGPTYHARYFQLKGYNEQQKRAFVESNKPAYIGFGTVSMLLQLIPIVSIFFAYTNTIGAALWAIDIEKGRRPVGSVLIPDVRKKVL